MKGLKLLLLVGTISVCVVKGYSQTDSATVYRHGLPVSEDDTVQNFPQYDYYPKNIQVVIPDHHLPSKLHKTLHNNPRYKGWDQLPVYYNKNTDIYTIRILENSDTTFIGLNKNGKPVSYGNNSVEDD